MSDSLFLAKSCIVDLFKDLSQEEKVFKNILSTKITLKLWNNATNTYDIETVHFKSEEITVINKKFNLDSAYEELKHKLDIWGEGGSGWIVDKFENIWIKTFNYDPLAGSSYIPYL